ncbi:MAG: hypothetical protein ACYC1D_00550 [Acidimicrobiales bacterium]
MTVATSFIAGHGLHLAELALPVAWIAWIIMRERRSSFAPADHYGTDRRGLVARDSKAGRSPRRVSATLAVWTLVVTTVGASAVHASIPPQHFAEGAIYGLFFAGLALGKLALAGVIAWNRVRRVVAALAAGNVATICLWLLTRLLGIPGGPRSGLREPFTIREILASSFEAAGVAAAAVLLRRREDALAAVDPDATTVATRVPLTLRREHLGARGCLPGDPGNRA